VLGYISLADFCVAEDAAYIKTVYPEEYKKWEFMGRIKASFEKLP